MPDLHFELRAGGLVAGVDEAGRGPWAGPVVAAAVILNRSAMPDGLADALDDSKRLSAARRRVLLAALGGCARIGVGAASVAEIDTDNILNATMTAMRRAVGDLGVVPDLTLIDGNRAPDLPCPAQTIIGGDRRSLSIAAASIVAKVTRDGIMASLSRRYPEFGWERNAGYGTGEHRAAMERVGITPHHRRSYRPVIQIVESTRY